MRESGAALEYTAVGQAPQAGGQDYTKGLRPLKPRRKSLSREYIALTSLKSGLFSLFRTTRHPILPHSSTNTVVSRHLDGRCGRPDQPRSHSRAHGDDPAAPSQR